MIAYPSIVRKATVDDIDALLLFVPQVLEETSLLPISINKIESLIERCASQTSGSIAGIIHGEDGNIDASVGLTFCESEVSDTPYLRAIWCGLHPSIRKQPSNPNDPRAHYGQTLFKFATWFHQTMERVAGHNVLMTFDIATRNMLGAKIRLYQRHMPQTGASFSLGAKGDFVDQKVEGDEIVV